MGNIRRLKKRFWSVNKSPRNATIDQKYINILHIKKQTATLQVIIQETSGEVKLNSVVYS